MSKIIIACAEPLALTLEEVDWLKIKSSILRLEADLKDKPSGVIPVEHRDIQALLTVSYVFLKTLMEKGTETLIK